MQHVSEMLNQYDSETERLLKCQALSPEDPAFGAFIRPDHQIDTREIGFALAHLCVCYVSVGSRYHHAEAVAFSLSRGMDYLRAHLRPGGCVDLTSCNFASAPDTAFTVNELILAWYLLEKDVSPEVDWLRAPLRELIERCAEGVMNGGFHTPNHRWAIAACLKHAAKIAGRGDFSRRADVYLGEGLDIDENGEFAERSTGVYNAVNDDQMVRLYLATGDRTYLEAARSNLMMTLNYIDPDGSLFTFNSTRQDYGTKVYPTAFYKLFLLVGWLMKDASLAAWAEVCWSLGAAHGRMPDGLPWLLLYPELEDFGRQEKPDRTPLERYDRLFPASGIARVRRGDYSCTVMAGRANFLHFQHGANSVSLALYANVCDARNFISDSIERTGQGFRLRARADSWYYLPFEGDGPATRDWWAMDNATTRRRMIADTLDTVVDIAFADDGVDVRVRAEGLDGVPARFELAFAPGSEVRNENFVLTGAAGGQITVLDGRLQATDEAGDAVTIAPCFAAHNMQRRLGGAYPLSPSCFNVFLTDHTPFDRTIHIGTRLVFPLTLEPGAR